MCIGKNTEIALRELQEICDKYKLRYFRSSNYAGLFISRSLIADSVSGTFIKYIIEPLIYPSAHFDVPDYEAKYDLVNSFLILSNEDLKIIDNSSISVFRLDTRNQKVSRIRNANMYFSILTDDYENEYLFQLVL